MRVEATTESPLATDADTIVVGVFEDERGAGVVPGAVGSLIDSGEARGKLESVAVAHEQGRRLIAVGLGRRESFAPEAARRAAAAADRRAREIGSRTLCWQLPEPGGEELAAAIVEGTLLHAHRFERYKPADERPAAERLILAAERDLSEAVHDAAAITAAQNRARDLGDTAGNDLPPVELARYASALADRHETITVTIFDEARIREMGMGAFAAVAQGSTQDAQLIRIDYEGPGARGDAAPLAFIGKGVTFDSGGISLKSGADMDEMKFDMCGAAAVIESVAALAELRVPVRILGLVGATENMPSGNAVKPGDIVHALDGTTIEIDNTDAEGRLVLADCIAYARREGCERLVDLATLTGAVVVALGSTYAGLMTNDDPWSEQVQAAAGKAGEAIWRLPLHPDYAKMITGRYAQLTNRARRREAMAITAAELLHHFAGDTPWAHIDIAGTAWDVQRPYFVGKGATGFGVRLLVELARSAAGSP